MKPFPWATKSVFRSVIVVGVLALASAWSFATARAADVKITVGRTTGASGFHIPSYVAMDLGFFKKEGLDAEFVAMTGKALVTAGMSKQVLFVPIPGGGSVAMLKGAPITLIVGQSTISLWTIVTNQKINRVEDLKGKILGLGRPGSADYDEATITLGKFFKMEPGRDYKVISFAGEPERIAGLINGDIQGAIMSLPHAANAEAQGFKILVRTGDYLPRLGGSVWTHKDFVAEKPDVVKRFIKAIAKAEDFIPGHKNETVKVIEKYFGIDKPKIAEAIYQQIKDKFDPDISPDLLRKLFESRATPRFGWPEGKPLPDLEQFVARDLLNSALKELGKK
jgi:NitT/TauT family transport system substrate-binding protein